MNLQPVSNRVQSVDMLRGIVMVIMALDHVRDFFSITPFDPVDVAQTTPAWYFTRWITHFCAPVFVMLAGVSAYLYGTKVSRSELRKFLLTRGLWLIFIEVTIVNFAINFDFNFIFLQVIWTIGICLILLSVMISLPRWVLIVLTVVMIAGHNLLDGVQSDLYLWKLLHEQYFGPPVSIFYPLIPWPALIVLGYLLGELFTKTTEERKRKLWLIGGSFILGFIVIRAINIYGDPHTWTISDRGALYTFLDLMNVSKYPPSLLYVLITIGPALLLLPLLEKVTGKIGSFFLTFGRVPFFYYVLHFYVIHLLAIVCNGIFYNEWRTWAFGGWPEEYVPSLLLCYGAWVFVIGIMYFLCRWFVRIKKTRTEWWLKYL